MRLVTRDPARRGHKEVVRGKKGRVVSMNDSPAMFQAPGDSHFMPGMPVYDKAGEMVGTLDAESLEHPYLTVRHGETFPHDLYVPAEAVAQVAADGVYLKLARRTLRGRRYASLPEAEVGTVPAREVTTGTEPVGAQGASAAAVPASAAGTSGGRVVDEGESRVSVPLVREDLVTRRSAEQVGTVRLRKAVETQEQAYEVPITREEVIVEHIPADQVDSNAAVGANELLIPIMEEQIVVQKRMVVKEYVRVRKRRVAEQRQVREPVRREVLSVQEQASDGSGQPEWPLVREMRPPGAEGTEGTDANANA